MLLSIKEKSYMSIGKTVIAAGFAVPFAFIVSTQAFSAENGEAANEASESQALLTAKIGLADAIKAAEEDSKGKAVESSFTAESGTPGYQVEVVTSDGA